MDSVFGLFCCYVDLSRSSLLTFLVTRRKQCRGGEATEAFLFVGPRCFFFFLLPMVPNV